MKTCFWKAIGAGVGIVLASSVWVRGGTLYDNTTTDKGTSLNFINGYTLGDEIIMGNAFPSDIVSNFSFEIYSPLATFSGGANVKMEVFLYANDGAPTNGFARPGSSLYDSGAFTLSTPQQFGGSNVFAATLTFDLSSTPVFVPNDFTLAVKVTGLTGGDTVGMEMFEPATVGRNYGEYWMNNGTSWGLYTNSIPLDFGARFQGTPTVPEPSTLCLGAVGAAFLMGFTWLRRRRDQLTRTPK
jgi:hypothetical protein